MPTVVDLFTCGCGISESSRKPFRRRGDSDPAAFSPARFNTRSPKGGGCVSARGGLRVAVSQFSGRFEISERTA